MNKSTYFLLSMFGGTTAAVGCVALASGCEWGREWGWNLILFAVFPAYCVGHIRGEVYEMRRQIDKLRR